ncbi:MAG: laccase domain-containing protein, partial [Bacteroidaceae bacterium]|nr:laccase domain-containing protein [Bacteroidaceae bacterium]
ISQESFEVGDEVYEAFREAAFPMERISSREEKWYIDLWEANKWLLEEMGVKDIYVSGIDTMTSPEWYSARRETINTGRNYNAIFFLPS